MKSDFGKIKQIISEAGYILLTDTYVDNKTPLLTICPNGHHYAFRWYNFQRGVRCPCMSHKMRHTIEDIKCIASKEGYQIMSNNYESIHKRLDFLCPMGHKTKMTWRNFQAGHRCQICALTKTADGLRLDFDEVKRYFYSKGYEVLSSDYRNNQTHLQTRCPKKHAYLTTFGNFRQGHRCPLCREWKNERKLGELLKQLFPGETLSHNDNLDFLKYLKVDYSIRRLGLAFEYDGEQHFRPIVGFFGCKTQQEAEQRFEVQQRRDLQKSHLCKQNGYKLIRVTYMEKLSLKTIKAKMKEVY